MSTGHSMNSHRIDRQSGLVKAVFALFLSLVLAVSLAPGPAFASEERDSATKDTATSEVVAQDEKSVEQDVSSDNLPADSGEVVGEPSGDAVNDTEQNVDTESDSADEHSAATVASDDSEEGIQAQSITTQAGQLELEVTIPSNIECNNQVTFGFNLKNAPSGKKATYQIDSLEIKTTSVAGATWNPVTKFAANEKAFTFKASGDYRMSVTAIVGNNENRVTTQKTFTIADPKAPSLDTLAQQIASQYDNSGYEKSQYGKTLFVHDYLANTLGAKASTSDKDCGPYSVLLDKKGTSEAFHKTMAMLLFKMGVSTRSCSADGYTWTLVLVDNGLWMHVDALEATKRSGNLQHLYFGLTDSQMKKLRPSYVPQSGATATNSQLHKFRKDGTITTWSNTVKDRIAAQVGAGKVDFTVAENRFSDPALCAILCDNVALSLTDTNIGGKQVLVQFINKGPNYTQSYYQVSTKSLNSIYMSVTDLKSSYDANGKAQTPTPTLTLNGTRLQKDRDYTITYSNNVNPGTATMVIRGKGSFTGSITKTFKINATPQFPVKGTGKWVKSGSRWWYSYDAASKKSLGKSYPTNEWVLIGNKRYHFDGSGWMNAKWLRLSGKWYWLGSDGALKTGWKKVSGKWYYLDPASNNLGVMKTGWYTVGKTKYYSNSSGAMKTGWQRISGKWYYFASSGAMKTGWAKIKGKWYYLDPAADGAMVSSMKKVIGNKSYFFNSSGAMMKGWIQTMGSWFYCNSSGAMQTNKWIQGKYWVQEDGIMATNSWVDNDRYYVDGSGKWVKGKKK